MRLTLSGNRRALLAVAVAAATAAVTAVGVAAVPSGNAAVTCGVLFDDFAYSSRTDPALGANGWSIRSSQGGPGVPGTGWSASNVSFPTADGQKVAQLRASTDGTAGGTSQSEFSLSNRRFFEGTYLARIKFQDAPTSGADGDHVNQTFYSISPLAYPRDPTYSELDYTEYLPNGGWGKSTPTDWFTTWYTYVEDPWYQDSKSSSADRSIAGWHDIMATVAGGHVKYYLDGALVGDHSGKFYPRQNMSIDFNQWFIDLDGHSGGTSVWTEQVDYVLHAKKQVLSPSEAASRVSSFRSSGTTHADNVTANNSCTPSTTPPTTRPPKAPPTTTPPKTTPPADGS
jgi:hypothetical protein